MSSTYVDGKCMTPVAYIFRQSGSPDFCGHCGAKMPLGHEVLQLYCRGERYQWENSYWCERCREELRKILNNLCPTCRGERTITEVDKEIHPTVICRTCGGLGYVVPRRKSVR